MNVDAVVRANLKSQVRVEANRSSIRFRDAGPDGLAGLARLLYQANYERGAYSFAAEFRQNRDVDDSVFVGCFGHPPRSHLLVGGEDDVGNGFGISRLVCLLLRPELHPQDEVEVIAGAAGGYEVSASGGTKGGEQEWFIVERAGP